MQLILSIIFIILALISWASVVAYFPFGIPLGLLFLCFSIWSFAIWRYKKSIQLNVGGWLLLLPILGFLPLIIANKNFGLVHLFFAENLPPSQVPWWGVLLGAFDAFVLPLLFLGVLLWVIIYFFRQVRKIV
jgi:hypothetical protein